jgi:adenylate cyclase
VTGYGCKPPGSLDAWTAYQRGLWHFSKGTPDDNTLAESFFQQAIDLDPGFAGGYTGLAYAHTRAAGVYGNRNLAEIWNSTFALARRAVTLDGNDAEARTCLAEQLMRRGTTKPLSPSSNWLWWPVRILPVHMASLARC